MRSEIVHPYQDRKFLGLAFAAYVVIWFMQVGIRKPYLGAIRIEFIWAVVLILAGFLTTPRGGYGLLRNSLFKWAALLFLAMLIQIPFSHNVQHSWTIFTDRVVKFSFMGWFIVMFVRSPRQLRWFLAAFLFSSLYITQESFRGALDGSMIWENQGIPRLHGTTPLYAHPNSLAGVALGTFPFIFYLFPVVKKFWIKAVLICLSVTAGGCLLYSGSRTGYLGFFIFLFVIAWRTKHFARTAVLLSLLVGLSVPFLPDHYVERFTTIFAEEGERGGSAEKRVEILEDSVEILKNYPLGVGVAAFPMVRRKMFGHIQDTHNLYLEVATNLGFQGLVVFLIMIFSMLKSFGRTVRLADDQLKRLSTEKSGDERGSGAMKIRDRHESDLRLVKASASAGIAYIWVRLALGLFGHDLYEIYWWLGIGLAISLGHIVLSSRESTMQLVNREP